MLNYISERCFIRLAKTDHIRSKLRSSVSSIAIAVGLLTLAGTSSADAQTFDQFVIIQPIQVCDDAGNNCAVVDLRHAATARTLQQAGVLPIYLPQTQFNSTALLAANNGPSSFSDANGGSANALTLNMWFTGTGSIDDCGGPGTNIVGCANTPGRFLVIDGPFNANSATDNGLEQNLIPHEIGHTFGLVHTAPTADLMNDTVQTDQFAAIGVTNFLLTDAERTTIRDNARSQASAVNCIGDTNLAAGSACLNVFGQGGNNVITLNNGSGVLQNVQGDDGDDTISIQSGSIVGGNVTGDANNDTLNIGGIVMNDVLGGTGDDDIIVLSTAQVIRNIDGGSGTDEISIAGRVAAGNFAAIAGTGALTTAIVASPTQVRGGADGDTITVQAGAIVAGSVFGDDNDGNEANDAGDTITVSGGQVIGTIDGEGGSDIITISDGAIRAFTDGGAGSPTQGGSVLGGGGGDTIAVTGGRIARNVEGEDGDDTISILGGTVFGNVLGGEGADTISLAEPGTVDGNVDGGAGTDTITIASDPTNVFGGIGGDLITLNNGAVVTESVFGDDGDGNEGNGDGDDIIVMNGGFVVENVNGEGGSDQISILGGFVGNNIIGGGGADIVALGGGTVSGSVNTGDGQDIITLSATSVGGSIDAGADADTITINGGSVTSVFGGGGGDEANWTGGTIALSVDMGDGTDRLTIFGVNAGGTALQAGLTALDGGDDASSADGQIDILNLNGVVEVLTDLQNWEFINLNAASIASLGNATRTIDTEQFLISSTSTLIASSNVGGQTFTIDGNLVNFGSINMVGLTPNYDTLEATGTYDGRTGSTLSVDSFLGAFGSPSDLLLVGTNTIGNTGLIVNDTNAGPGVFNPIGIEVVRVEGAPGSTVQENFTLLGGPIEKDLWVFDLGLDNTRSNPGRANADVHVLYSRPGEIVQFSPFFVTGALSAFHSSLDPWIDRQHTLADAVASNNFGLVGLKDQPAARTGTFVDVWAAPFGSRKTEDAISTLTFFGDSFSARMDYDQTTYGFQAGVDLVTIMEGGDAIMAGVFGGFLNSSVTPDNIPVSGDYEGGTFGVYGSYVNGGFSLSAVGKVDLLNFDWRAPTLDLDASSDVNTFGGRLEAAYKLPVSTASWLEPYTNLTYAKSNWDQFSVLATTFSFDDNESILGRAGVRLGTDFQNSETLFTKVFAGVGVVYEFDENNTANIISGGFVLPLQHQADTTSLELQGGFKLEDISSGLAVSITSTGRFSEEAEEYGGKATVNYKF